MKKNVLNLMNLLSVTALLVFVLPAMTHAQGKANFSGTWTLNESKSTMPEGGGRFMGGSNFTVTQDAGVLTRASQGRNGEERVSKYNLDGKESVNTMGGRGESKSVATWSADGKSLTIKTTMEFNGNQRTSSEVWTMPDSKTLSITRTFTNRDGDEMKTTMVYDKK